MFYEYQNNKIISVSDTYDSSKIQMADERNIPLENAVLLNGLLYDNRELDYWKLLKTKELSDYLTNADNSGLVTSVGIKSDCTETSISKLNLGLSNYNLTATKDTDKVGFCDYNNNLHSITFAQFKQICKEVGADYSNRYGKKWTIRKAINEAKTVEEIKAIVI